MSDSEDEMDPSGYEQKKLPSHSCVLLLFPSHSLTNISCLREMPVNVKWPNRPVEAYVVRRTDSVASLRLKVLYL